MANEITNRPRLSPKVVTGKLMRIGTVSDRMIPIDEEIDGLFGEPVVLRPMRSVSGGYRDAELDPDRPELITRGVYDQTRGGVVETGGGSIHRQATVDNTLSIREEPIMRTALRKGDRVFFPDRDELYDVTHIDDDPAGRPEVHLVRVLED